MSGWAFFSSGLTTGDLSGTAVTSIGDGAFKSTSSLLAVFFPATLQVVGGQAFENSASLPFVYLPSGCSVGVGGSATQRGGAARRHGAGAIMWGRGSTTAAASARAASMGPAAIQRRR